MAFIDKTNISFGEFLLFLAFSDALSYNGKNGEFGKG